MNIVLYPNAKINIGLRVTERREDGFHNLETLFFPTKLCDILEISYSHKLSITHYGRNYNLPNNSPTEDICIKAYELLKEDFNIRPVDIHIYKNIPVGAGLGGGSSDGAHTLIGLNQIFKLGLTDDQLATYAAKLGSDCPFFIYNRPMFGTGRGEKLEEFKNESIQSLLGDSPKYRIEIISPEVHISTAEAYSKIKPSLEGQGLADILNLPISEWKNKVVNDFERAALEDYPELKQIKEELYDRGAIYASMTGSGSSLYGIFLNN